MKWRCNMKDLTKGFNAYDKALIKAVKKATNKKPMDNKKKSK